MLSAATRLRACLCTVHHTLSSRCIDSQGFRNSRLLAHKCSSFFSHDLHCSARACGRSEDSGSHRNTDRADEASPHGLSGLVRRLQSLNHEHTREVLPPSHTSPGEEIEEFSMDYFRAQETIDTTKLRSATFQDIGVPQQAAWYEIATGDPLQHKETNTLVYVHSVNRFHAASVETARSMIMLLRPSVLAVQLHNDMAPGIVDAARQRLAMISGPEHVHQIADGYQRVCLGVSETSDLNPDAAAMQRSYAEGRKLAALHEMEDYETVLEELAAFPAELQDFKQHTQDRLLLRDIWYAMFLSGMTPWEHLDRHIADAGQAGRRVELVDIPRPKLAELAQQLFGENLSAEDEMKEAQGFIELMHAQGRKTMPLHLPEDVWHVMSPTALAPGDMPEFFEKLGQVAPYTFELMKCRAAYMTRALDTLAREGMAGSGDSERHIVCLVDRMIEPLVRLQWDELHDASSSDVPDEKLVNSLPFLPKPMKRAKSGGQKRRK